MNRTSQNGCAFRVLVCLLLLFALLSFDSILFFFGFLHFTGPDLWSIFTFIVSLSLNLAVLLLSCILMLAPAVVAVGQLLGISEDKILPHWIQKLEQSKLNLFNSKYVPLWAKDDICISCRRPDLRAARKIRRILKKAGYSTRVFCWSDDKVFTNHIHELEDEASHLILFIWSPEYQQKILQHEEWIETFRRRFNGSGPSGKKGVLAIVRKCEPDSRLMIGRSLDLVGLNQNDKNRKKIMRDQLLLFIDDAINRQTTSIVGSSISVTSQPTVSSPQDLQLQRSIDYFPKPRNPFFTGREDDLQLLDTMFSTQGVQIVVISGMNGLGKSALAIEYGYRYRNNYGSRLWIDVSSQSAFAKSCQEIAHLLDEPEDSNDQQTLRSRTTSRRQSRQDNQRYITLVQRWLSLNTNWLLVLDKYDNERLQLPQNFFFNLSNGCILITKLGEDMPVDAYLHELKPLEPNEGALFLLRYIRKIQLDAPLSSAFPQDRKLAIEISERIDGLPLGLKQVGDYILYTSCPLSDYPNRYESQRATLLNNNSYKKLQKPHFVTIATNWRLALERIRTNNPQAEALLLFFAFFAREPIPESFIRTHELGNELGDDLQKLAIDQSALDTVIADLRKYSLISDDSRREMRSRSAPTSHIGNTASNSTEKNFVIHSSLQDVLQERVHVQETADFRNEQQRLWAERAIAVVNKNFPMVEFTTWQVCSQYLSHAQACLEHVKRWNIETTSARQLLYKVGQYLQERELSYVQAQEYLNLALKLSKEMNTDYPNWATCLNGLANVLLLQGQYELALAHYEQALKATDAAQQQQTEQGNTDKVIILDNLGLLYEAWGKYEQAKEYFEQAMQLCKQQIQMPVPAAQAAERRREQLDITLAIIKVHIADVGLRDAGNRYTDSPEEQYLSGEQYLQALSTFRERLGNTHPYTIQCTAHLAVFYTLRHRYREAEDALREAIKAGRGILKEGHPLLAAMLNNRAELYRIRGKYQEAEKYYRESLAVYEKYKQSQGGRVHPAVNPVQKNLKALQKCMKLSANAM